jgi:glyceraldehyde-3-phosphate dehydrogenase/erythrose-4-phosphate dehydrogenase
VYDGATLLDDTIRVNQLADGGQWNPVGVYAFNDTARVVIVSSGSCTTNADAVRLSATAP